MSIDADLYAQERNADARAGTPAWSRRGGKAPPVPAVPQVLQLQPPVSPAHQGAHWGEAVQMLLLRSEVQAVESCATTHQITHRRTTLQMPPSGLRARLYPTVQPAATPQKS